MIETDRLLLREYTMDDFDALYEIMSDAETMQHYPAPFDEARTRRWIEWNIDNYSKYGFGLWAVVLKETGEFIGDCGITIQNIDGEMLPEIGYHIHKKYWRRGFAKEAAQAVRDWVFRNTDYDTIYSYMKYTNVASYSTALANGMKKVKEYPDPKNTVSYAYAITRREWEDLYGSEIEFRKADIKDAELLIDIYNASFYEDYIRYGECPAYGKTREMMEQSITEYSKFLIIYDGKAVGCISCRETEKGIIEVGCLCVIPEFQGRGIGTAAMKFARSYYSDWKRFVLVTPADKSENIRFYTDKCGFAIQAEEMDGNVKVLRFVLER